MEAAPFRSKREESRLYNSRSAPAVAAAPPHVIRRRRNSVEIGRERARSDAKSPVFMRVGTNFKKFAKAGAGCGRNLSCRCEVQRTGEVETPNLKRPGCATDGANKVDQGRSLCLSSS